MNASYDLMKDSSFFKFVFHFFGILWRSETAASEQSQHPQFLYLINLQSSEIDVEHLSSPLFRAEYF